MRKAKENMNFKPDTLKNKQQVLDLLKFGPYSFEEIKDLLQFDKFILCNYLTSLKKNKMVAQETAEEAEHPKKRKYKLNTDKTLAEVMIESQSKVTAGVRKHFEKVAETKQAAANGVRVISSDDYHTFGNKGRAVAWSGYTTFSEAI